MRSSLYILLSLFVCWVWALISRWSTFFNVEIIPQFFQYNTKRNTPREINFYLEETDRQTDRQTERERERQKERERETERQRNKQKDRAAANFSALRGKTSVSFILFEFHQGRGYWGKLPTTSDDPIYTNKVKYTSRKYSEPDNIHDPETIAGRQCLFYEWQTGRYLSFIHQEVMDNG